MILLSQAPGPMRDALPPGVFPEVGERLGKIEREVEGMITEFRRLAYPSFIFGWRNTEEPIKL